MRQIWNWLRRHDLEHSLDRELQYHLDRRVSDLMGTGVPEAEARRQARLELGGLTLVREEVRDVWFTRWLRDFAADFRLTGRSFLRGPSFSAVIVLSLALGIGATTAIYSLVDQVILRALPIRQPERLVLIDWQGDQVASGFGTWNLMSYPICRDLQLQDQFFDGVLCRAAANVNLSTGGESRPAAVEIVSGTYFSTLGIGPALGRVLSPEDDQTPEASPVVVLAYDFWKTQFSGAPNVVGRKILINRHPMTVVGVAARAFHGVDVGQTPVLWVPASMSSQAIPGFQDMLDRRTRWMQILGHLREGITPEKAQAGLQPWFKSMLEEDSRRAGFPRIGAARRRRYFESTLTLKPAPQGHSALRRALSEPLWVLLAATALLLCLACLNVAGLFLARGLAREREIGTRLALGASRGRIARQLLADAILYSLAGGLLGVALSPFVMRSLIAFLPQDVAATSLQSTLDARLLLFAFVVSVVSGLASGLAPALTAGRESLVTSLRARSTLTFGAMRLRKVMVTGQIAFSLLLLIGAMLFARTLAGLLAKGPGFATTSLVAFSLDTSRNGYSPADGSRLMHRIQDEITASAMCQASGMTRFPLLTGGSWNNGMTIQAGQRITTDREVNMNAVTPEFFSALGIPVLAGRNFDQRDSRPSGDDSYRTAMVNETFVKRYLAGQNPIGAHVGFGTGPDAKTSIEVVGVVADSSYRDLREESEQAFFPYFQTNVGSGTFYVKVRSTPEAAFQSIRAIVQRADPSLPILSYRTMTEQIGRSLKSERMLAALSEAFGALALLLSLVGLYGVMSFMVTERTREIGIRMALGATGASTVWLVLRDALVMVAVGWAIALPCVHWLGRLVESQLFGVTATDFTTIAQATLLLASAAIGAAFIPAYRAASANPIDALRLD